MPIQRFPKTQAGQLAAFAVGNPKHVVFENDGFLVLTGANIPVIQLSQDELDAIAANAYQKLTDLKSMTPAQIQAWVSANVTDLAKVQDAITTLAIGVGILGRRI